MKKLSGQQRRTLTNWVYWLSLIAFYLFGGPVSTVPNYGTVTGIDEVREDDRDYKKLLSKSPIHTKIEIDEHGERHRVWDRAYRHYFVTTKDRGITELSEADFIALHNAYALQYRRFLLIFGGGTALFLFWRVFPERKRRRLEERERRTRESELEWERSKAERLKKL